VNSDPGNGVIDPGPVTPAPVRAVCPNAGLRQ